MFNTGRVIAIKAHMTMWDERELEKGARARAEVPDRVVLNRAPVLFRLFRVVGRQVEPLSSFKIAWRHGYPMREWVSAMCPYGCLDDLIPNRECTCGIYVFTSVEALRVESTTHPGVPLVIGAVEVSGRMAVHDKGGIRVQRARLLRLWPADSEKAIRACRALEKVWNGFAAENGLPIYRPPDVYVDEAFIYAYYNMTTVDPKRMYDQFNVKGE